MLKKLMRVILNDYNKVSNEQIHQKRVNEVALDNLTNYAYIALEEDKCFKHDLTRNKILASKFELLLHQKNDDKIL